ncbi:hypothetical protein BJY01DRAFT_208481 [Aspergillus pseudoustus]|uniref:Uncharacterized protein n=1 Tax=Aspergillus pseudoustus TaxID=1810923 RepID=A0ABR4KLM5_9EURO
MITDHLDRADTVCFTLSSRKLLGNIGTASWPQRKDRGLRISVLSRVAKDQPSVFCCHYCSKLHPTSLVGRPTEDGYAAPGAWDKCPEIGGTSDKRVCGKILSPVFEVCGLGDSYRFRMCHLMLAMKRHYLGPQHGIPLDMLSYTEVAASDVMFTTLVSVGARICPL